MNQAVIDPFLHACDAGATAVHDVDGVAALLRTLLPCAQRVHVRDGDLPWGRYLLHEATSYNLQLDVFSADYTGSVHAHGTWGIFFVLRGALYVDDHDANGIRTRSAYIGAGGAQGFCPPVSDWHRVCTPAAGPQTVSLHLYGAGFDLDTGVARGPDGQPRAYRRGPWGEPAKVQDALVTR